MGDAAENPDTPYAGSSVVAALRMATMVLCSVVTLPLQYLLSKTGHPLLYRGARMYHRMLLAILGIKVVVRGVPCRDKGILYVANHVSYLDIPVIGSVLLGSFIAKDDVRDWPVFGAMSKLQRTEFIDRTRRSKAASQKEGMQARLESGDSLILFPEGTSSDGRTVLPFRSSLFAAAAGAKGVQPFTVAFRRLYGLPTGRILAPLYAWYGDMGLMSHLWQVMSVGGLTIELTFHPVMDAKINRKILAEESHRQIASAISANALPVPPTVLALAS